jgi:riboflavin-specific deaminase-like protein
MFVFSNLAMSLDGKIAAKGRGFFPLGSPNDLKEMLRLRRSSDAILIGASTLRPYRKASLARPGPKQPLNVLLSSSLAGLSPRWPFFRDERIRRMIFTTSKASPARRRIFEKSSEVIVLGSGRLRASRILEVLAKRGIKRLVIEGGGAVMWEFVQGDLIDEYHVTVTPRLLGGQDAPTLIDGEGFTPARSLKLKLVSCRRVGQELFLVYRR